MTVVKSKCMLMKYEGRYNNTSAFNNKIPTLLINVNTDERKRVNAGDPRKNSSLKLNSEILMRYICRVFSCHCIHALGMMY